MLDIRLLRSEPEMVKERLKRRLSDPERVDRVIDVDSRWRATQTEVEALQASVKRESAGIGQLMRENKKQEAEAARAAARELGDRVAQLDEVARTLEAERDALLYQIPNLPHSDTPEGPEENYRIVRTHGELPTFDFAPKPNWELAADLGLIDFVRGTKLSGSGFLLYKGLGAMFERALIQFMLDFHRTQHGFTEWLTPLFLSRESMRASGHLAKESEMYHDQDDDLFAVPTAEPALVNIHRDEILDAKDLPLRYVAYSPCWRREAGAAGKLTRGLLRLHQFDKVEMVKYTLPERSYDELELMVNDACDILTAFGLAYRIKLIPGGDLSFAGAKQYDIEIFAPGTGEWLEVSSCSNCEDFQSRQGSIRFRREPGARPEFVHLLNGSGTALSRLFATLIETYQSADGTVSVPTALQPYLGGRAVLSKE